MGTRSTCFARSSVVELYVGASGFSYPSWKPGFYPAGTKPADFLRLYAERLNAVELNNTFYQLPSEERLAGWAAQTPPGFRFAVKMNRRITHFGQLDLIPAFCERVRALGDRLGPILVQLPPSRPRDDGLLELYLGSLDPQLDHAFEFRHRSWDGVDVPVRVGSLAPGQPFHYLRLREPPYDEAALAAWAERVRALPGPAYVFFKHEDDPTAPAYAGRLRALAA